MAQVWLQAGLLSEHDSSMCAQLLQTDFGQSCSHGRAQVCPSTCCVPAPHAHPTDIRGRQQPGVRQVLPGAVCLQAECFSCHLVRHSWSMSASPPAAPRRLCTAWEVAAANSAGSFPLVDTSPCWPTAPACPVSGPSWCPALLPVLGVQVALFPADVGRVLQANARLSFH